MNRKIIARAGVDDGQPTTPRRVKKIGPRSLPAVAAHPRFSPEIARRLGYPTFTKELYLSAYSLNHFVEHPVELLKETIRTLDAGSRAMKTTAIPAGLATRTELITRKCLLTPGEPAAT